MENWKDVPGWENYYEVSNLGQIRSKTRVGRTLLAERKYGGGILNPITNSRGYQVVNLTRRDPLHVRQQYVVHRLVLLAFVGEKPNGWHGCHSDGDKTNNKLDNLRWGSPRENCYDKKLHGTWQCGEKHGNSIYTEEQVREIYRLYSEDNLSPSKIKDLLGLPLNFIAKICYKQSWTFIHNEKEESQNKGGNSAS